MNDDQLLRYSRHILLNELGIEGQKKLLASHVLIVGAGGLGSPAALYLGSAGVGRLTIVDGDRVDATNLQRQIAHNMARIGQFKAQSVAHALAAINPEIKLTPVTQEADNASLDVLVRDADLVLDCTDNFATRHAINRACVKHQKPLISGAAIRFDGQVTVFDLRDPTSPCYACVFPPTDVPQDTPCAVMGIFSPLVGIVGSLQAAEAMKLLCGMGHSMTGSLMLVDSLTTQWTSIKVTRDSNCPICGKH